MLEQRLIQTLSPQMIHYMSLLQMGARELQEFVDNLLLENPVLDAADIPPADNHIGSRHVSVQSDWEPIRSAVDLTEESLFDHLSIQIPWKTLSPTLRRGVECVLSGLDDNGWLGESPRELARRGGVDAQTIRQAEELVRTLEPAGVGARTLSQCLELQLLRRGEQSLALTIVRDHLEDLAKCHYNRICSQTGATPETVRQACQVIRGLDPRPGAPFARREPPAYIMPDLLAAEEDGTFVVTYLDHGLPELSISPSYLELLQTTDDPQVREYLREKIRQASWVVRHIAQRRDTVVRCAQVLVRRQEEVFRRGRAFLRPLTLAEVAGEVGLHPSTVSRAVRGKYIQCDHGLFPLRWFFCRPVGGENVTVQQTKTVIRLLISAEDKGKPLSDQTLCDLLAGQGISVARRTVAKYREEMHIPSSPGRRKL